jgi:hypothetical protein
MKIRIKGNSLRYRLTRSEVDLFAKKGVVREKINFGTAVMQYELLSSTGHQLSAAYQDNHITLYFPAAWINDWINTDKVGYKHTLPLENNEALHLLVEKDFTCMDNIAEDQTDNYPNPLLNKKA